ncbi:hypothetical protein CEXT_60761 [Caerostris extrusa]|uniref:Uncharacterized protein n=1 Tax=Caerostris extrusa TaxID=172846 RepID=A0AAV4XBN8_CAEEX|nr:hypothetical protein CEXT_60761 [Caerostris extrusa]
MKNRKFQNPKTINKKVKDIILKAMKITLELYRMITIIMMGVKVALIMKDKGGYNNPAYLGVSFTTFNDQGGRGGGYHSDSSANNEYNNQEGYENQEEGNHNHDENQGYDDGKYQEQYNNGGRGENGFGNIPALTLYQLHNGAATAISNNAGVNYYNTGYQQQDHSNQGVNSQGYGYNGNAGYEKSKLSTK